MTPADSGHRGEYLLIICHDDAFSPTEELLARIAEWDRELQRQGIRHSGNPLRPASEAMTVRVRGGAMQLTEGPFAKAPGQMAAYELVECASLEEAVVLASKHPMAAAGTIEVRPVWEDLAEQNRRRSDRG